MNLDFKYWGQNCLTKIVSQIGRYVKVDNATMKRERLQYARVQVEVEVSQEFPEEIVFENEMGVDTTVSVRYDWKPIYCNGCKVFGHKDDDCRRRNTNGCLREGKLKE